MFECVAHGPTTAPHYIKDSLSCSLMFEGDCPRGCPAPPLPPTLHNRKRHLGEILGNRSTAIIVLGSLHSQHFFAWERDFEMSKSPSTPPPRRRLLSHVLAHFLHSLKPITQVLHVPHVQISPLFKPFKTCRPDEHFTSKRGTARPSAPPPQMWRFWAVLGFVRSMSGRRFRAP